MSVPLETVATMVAALGFAVGAATYFVVTEKRKFRVRKLEQLLKEREEKKSNDAALFTTEPVTKQLFIVPTESSPRTSTWGMDEVLPPRISIPIAPVTPSAQEKLRVMRERLQKAT